MHLVPRQKSKTSCEILAVVGRVEDLLKWCDTVARNWGVEDVDAGRTKLYRSMLV